MFKHLRIGSFGIRLLVCLIVVGGAYFGYRQLFPEPPPLATPYGKLAALRSALDQIYLSQTAITNFSKSGASDASAFHALDDMRLQFERSTADLQTASTSTASLLSDHDTQTVKTILAKARSASAIYKSSYGALGQVISYDPVADMGSIDMTHNSAKLTTRAAAAQKGLLKAANNPVTAADIAASSSLSVQSDNGPAPLISPDTKAIVLSQASCFARLVEEVSARQEPSAAATRQDCINSYAKVRQAAVQNVIANSWGPSYQNFTNDTIPPLLRQLDNRIKTAR